MNKYFVVLRFLTYTMLFSIVYFYHHTPLSLLDWIITFIVIGWGAGHLWKKPNDEVLLLRRGIWIEIIMISIWVAFLQDYLLLFAYISPLLRSSVHLHLLAKINVFLLLVVAVTIFGWWLPGSNIMVPIFVFIILALYGSTIGGFLNEREKARRLVALSGFEKEQMARDQERVRISLQLHDTMGQNWTAVIRALDVAAALHMPEKQEFIWKARQAGEQGLTEMRDAVRRWNEGKQTPEEWMSWMMTSIDRLQELTKMDIQVQWAQIEWNRFNNAIEMSEFISRTIIESLTNAIRHGLAEKAWIFIQFEDSTFRVTIRDNGKGFSTKVNNANKGIGLVSLQQMAMQVGAKIRIESISNSGTTVQIDIYYQR